MRSKWIVLILSAVIAIGVTACNHTETGQKGDFIIHKGQKSILVAFDIFKSDIEKSVFKLREEDTHLMYYIIEDQDMFDRLEVGERDTVEGGMDYVIMFSDPPKRTLGSIIRHSVNDEKWVIEWDEHRSQFVRQ